MKLLDTIKTAWKEYPIRARLVVILELALLLVCLVGALLPKETYDLSAEEMGNPLALHAGVYRIQVSYEASPDAQAAYQVSATVPGGKLLTDTVNLFNGRTCSDSTVYLTGKTDNLLVTCFNNGAGTLQVNGMRVVETAGFWTMRLFVVILCSLIVNAVLLTLFYDRRVGLSPDQKLVKLGLLGIGIFSSIPLFMDYIPQQDDVLFHLSRIEGIARALREGIFPVRVQPGWLGDQGYGASLFYGDTLLYIPALLRLMGFSLQTAYQMFLVGMNFLTAYIVYRLGKKLTGEAQIGVIGALLYCGSTYRLINLYARGALGEALAMTFLPLVIFGLYRILAGDIKDKDYGKAFILPAIGYALIIQSHTVSIEMVGILTILVCLIAIRRTIQKERFFQLLKTAGCGLLLSAWFLVPFADELLNGTYAVTAIENRTIQAQGLYLTQLLLPWYHSGNTADFAGNGLQNSMPLGLGLGLLIILTGCLIYLFLNNQKRWEEKGAEKVLLLFVFLSLLFTLNVFPWDALQAFCIQKKGLSVVATLISSLQFPWRFLSIASPLIVFSGMLLLKHKKEGQKITGTYQLGILSYRSFALCLTMATVLTATIFFADLLNNRGGLRLYDDDSMGGGVILGGEFLPEGTDAGALSYGNCYVDGDLTLEGFSQDALTVTATVSGCEGTLTVPLLYYKGYVAKTTDGKNLAVFAGVNNQVTVQLDDETLAEGNKTAQVMVTFASPWYWRVAEILSLLSLAGMLLYEIKDRRLQK